MFNYSYLYSMETFYDALASDYDEMTDFDTRFGKEAEIFKDIIERYSIQTALDAGAGTGFHSLILAKLGVKVTAVDISTEMIGQLKENAKRLQLPVDTVVTDFERLTESISTTFDAVFCLGNSLVHLLTDDALKKTLSNFSLLLKPEGVLIIQILNYDRIMKERNRVQNIKKKGNTTFIRFYDYCNNRLFFNMLKLVNNDNDINHTLNTVELRPISKEGMTTLLKETGFTSIDYFGSLDFKLFDESKSSNLVTIAKK